MTDIKTRKDQIQFKDVPDNRKILWEVEIRTKGGRLIDHCEYVGYKNGKDFKTENSMLVVRGLDPEEWVEVL